MKTELTIEQSAKLIELGVSKWKSSKQMYQQTESSNRLPQYELKDIFTIADLLSMLPTSFKEKDYICELSILWDDRYSMWRVNYSPWISDFECREYELIDALYKTLIKLIEDNYINIKEL